MGEGKQDSEGDIKTGLRVVDYFTSGRTGWFGVFHISWVWGPLRPSVNGEGNTKFLKLD